MSPNPVAKNPPRFCLATKPYREYKKEVEIWLKITTVEPEKQGYVLALSLPDDDPLEIKRKVIDGVALDGAEGQKAFLKFLDDEFLQDKIVEQHIKTRKFIKYKKKKEESMQQYISNFNSF